MFKWLNQKQGNLPLPPQNSCRSTPCDEGGLNKKHQDDYLPSHDTRSEHEEARTEKAIRAAELSYRRLFEAAKDGILILDADTGRINDVNPFLFKLLGFSRSEMIGKTVAELSPFKDIESNQAMLCPV
jgi:PAS domain-containing protein